MRESATNRFEDGLDKNPANFTALTPLGFLQRSAKVYPDHLAVVHGGRRYTWAQTYERCRRLASALVGLGVGVGDTVSVMAANTPELYEAHFGVPMTGAVLNALNARLDAGMLAYILDHSETTVLITDREFAAVVGDALAAAGRTILVIDIDDPLARAPGPCLGTMDYEALLATGDPDFAWQPPEDEWRAISLNYTSGTTGRPKGVVYHHRGAHLLVLGNALIWQLPCHAAYLWTLPMFHCNGWCFPWTLAAVAGTSVCLRQVSGDAVWQAIAEHNVTHFCGAPIVLNMVINAAERARGSDRAADHPVAVMTAAAPPPAATLERMQRLGFRVTHVYGLTEVYGPSVVCAWQDAWDDLPIDRQADLNARQGVRYHVLEGLSVMDPETMTAVPADGQAMGEVMFRGNVVMKGYLKDRDATEAAFAGGWFHSGDLGVTHPDGYIQIKDRSKDIIISGGENISSIEVEGALHRHPAVLLAAVVAIPDDKWGETPCAFIELDPSADEVTAEDLIAFCRANLAHYKCPTRVIFTELPKTSTGKVQKFRLREKSESLMQWTYAVGST